MSGKGGLVLGFGLSLVNRELEIEYCGTPQEILGSLADLGLMFAEAAPCLNARRKGFEPPPWWRWRS